MSIDPESERMPRPRKIDAALIGIVITLFLQTSAVIWWASKMDARLSTLEGDALPLRTTMNTVARLDERTAAMRESMGRIERKFDEDRR